MITELYTFSPNSYVVAEEWNANFRVLYQTTLAHMEAITDAQATIAFPNSDLTDVYNAVRSKLNSFAIIGSTPSPSITVSPECEYYKTLTNEQKLIINVPMGLNAESRVLIQIQDNRTELPFSINYDGTSVINYGFYNYNYFRSGYYYVMIYETNGVAQVKLIWTGV